MATNPYPHLGWNPVPGIPGEVEALREKITKAATSLSTTHQRIEKLIGESSYWQGEAATAFRDSLDSDLPKYLKRAARSMDKAAQQLSKWHGSLTAHRDLARKYDDEAQEYSTALKRAQDSHDTAKKNPDLRLGGKTYPSQAEADDATARLQAAERELSSAAAAVTKASEAHEDVLKKARTLERTHSDLADDIAKDLDDATDELAPEEPGWLSKTIGAIWDVIKGTGEFLYTHIGTIGAIAGLLALLPTPAAPVFAAIGVACSAISLAKDVSSKWDTLTNPGFNMDTLAAYGAVAGDVVGLIPGGRALGKAGADTITAAAGAREAGEAMATGAKASHFVGETRAVFSNDALSAATNPSAWRKVDLANSGLGVGSNTVGSLQEEGVIPKNETADDSRSALGAGRAAYGGYRSYEGARNAVTEIGHALSLAR